MKTRFKVGMTVWDDVLYHGIEGKVIEHRSCGDYPIIVVFGSSKCSYTPDGRLVKDNLPTLSCVPYTFELPEQPHQFEVGDAVLCRDEVSKWFGGRVDEFRDGKPVVLEHRWHEVIPFDFDRMGTKN